MFPQADGPVLRIKGVLEKRSEEQAFFSRIRIRWEACHCPDLCGCGRVIQIVV
jgi:hypothetical protein